MLKPVAACRDEVCIDTGCIVVLLYDFDLCPVGVAHGDRHDRGLRALAHVEIVVVEAEFAEQAERANSQNVGVVGDGGVDVGDDKPICLTGPASLVMMSSLSLIIHND